MSITSVKTSLYYTKSTLKKVLFVFCIKILLSLWLLEKLSLSLLFCHYLRVIGSFHFQHGVSQLPARNLAEVLSRTNDSQHTDTLSCYKALPKNLSPQNFQEDLKNYYSYIADSPALHPNKIYVVCPFQN